MKSVILSITCFFFPLICLAQYNPYLNQQALQDAYNYGRQVREQWERDRKNNPNVLWSDLVERLGNGIVFESCYEKAYEDAEILADDHNDVRGYLMMGWLNEMGIGTSKSINYAKRYYEKGARRGNIQCKKELKRINNGQYLSERDSENFKLYYANLLHAAYSAAQSLNWDIPKSECPVCNGTRQCKYCNGTGYDEYGQNGRCGVCRGTGKCSGCN